MGFCRVFTIQSKVLTILIEKAFENILGNGENAGNQHFLLSRMFSTFTETNFIFFLVIVILQILGDKTSKKRCHLVHS